MNILLISPPSRIMNHYRPPLALMYLSGYLRKRGIEAKIVDVVIKEQVRDKSFYKNIKRYLFEVEEKIISEIKSSRTDILGITCYTPELKEVEQLASKVKHFNPRIKIIVGGIHPTLYPDDFLGANSYFDFVVIGEGEMALYELVAKINSGGNSYNDINGIGYFDKKLSKNIITKGRDLTDNLDEVSFPDYEGVDMKFYTTPSPYLIRGVYTSGFYISSSRGCPSSCTFCVAKKLRDQHGIKKFVRLRSPKSLFDEIYELRRKYYIDSFYFIDDLFTLSRKNVYEFCELMIKEKLPLIWGCSSKVNTVNYDILKKMRDAGCVQIDFGVERGSDKALQYLHKGITIDQIERTFNDCKKLGIRTFANMLVNIPGEDETDLKDIIKLARSIDPNIVSFNIFTPYPGCEIFDFLCKNIKKEDYPLLMEPPDRLVHEIPMKFRFASHSVDFTQWVNEMTKKYNKIISNMKIYMKFKFIKNIFYSKQKIRYLLCLKYLLKELFVQIG